MTSISPESNSQPSTERLDHLINSLDAQNSSYAQSNGLEVESLKTIVQSEITDRQVDALHELISLAPSSFYENIGALSLNASKELEEARERVNIMNATTQTQIDHLHKSVKLAVDLAPGKKIELEEAGDIEIAKIRNAISAVAIDELLQKSSDADTDFEKYGKAWPIPVSLTPQDRVDLYTLIEEEGNLVEDDKVSWVNVDIIPVTPEERIHQAEVADSARRTVENAEASNFITYYLAEKVGQVVTVDELARFLYVANVDEHRTHVTTLLGPKVQGKRIRKMLEEEYGLTLQYGWRRLRRLEDDKYIEERRTRIYRAVDLMNADELDDVIVRRRDDEKAVCDDFEPLESTGQHKKNAENDLLKDSVTNTAAQETEQSEEIRADWRDDFRKAVDDEIEKLIIDQLFIDDTMRGTVIRALSSSAKFGTETMRERMNAAKLLKISELKSDVMTREQRVIGALFNTNQDVLGKRGKKQREALAIIQEQIETRMSELNNKDSV